MRSKDNNKASKLLQLYNNRLLRSKVDVMLDENKPFSYILKYLETKGFSMQAGSLSNYRKKRIEALETKTPLINLLDRRKKNNVSYLKAYTKDKDQDTTDTEKEVEKLSSSNPDPKRISDIEFLDDIITKAYAGLSGTDFVDLASGVKAVEIKNKVTGNALHGLTIDGLKELRLKQEAEISALTEVVVSFIPEEKHEEVYKALDKARNDFYNNLDITKDGGKLKKAANEIGLDI